MTKISFWLKTVLCSFLFAVFIFGIFGFDNNSKIKNGVIKNTDAAETTSSCKGPADVILVIDRSATMINYNRFNIAKTASINFIDKLFAAFPDSIYYPNDYHQIGLVAFHGLTNDKGLNKSGDYIKGVINDSNGILGSDYPVGYRNTPKAIELAKNSLDPILSSPNPSATKTMIILTDGAPNYIYSIDDAIAFADSANSAGIRIISVGLKLDGIVDETERGEAENFIKDIASAPFDCYYASDSGAVLEGCNSVSAANLTDALDGVYTIITAAICDEDSPTVIISREPSGTLYSVDNLIINSTARDDVGFNSHSINWSSPSVTQNIECEDLVGTEIECSTGNLGPFSSSTNINYRSSVTDANDNEASIEEPDPRSVTVANVTLTIPALLRNKDNVIKAVISNYGGNDTIFVSIDAPVLTGIEIDKVAMTCSTSGSTRTCIYTFNSGCDWTDGITNGFANNIDVNIYFYAQSDDVGIRQIASSENRPLASNSEGSSWTGTCTDTLNNDCDYDIFNDPIIDLEENLCDTENPAIGISRDPAGDVYDLESDGITPMTVMFESVAGDSNGIKRHTIYYKIDDGSLQVAFDCNDANADSLCDEDISQNVNNISATVGPFNAGKNVEYYSTAIDYSGNNNTTSTLPENFIVKNRECEGVIDLGDCLVTGGGKCCGEVCDTSAENSGPLGPYNTDFCAELSCDGIDLKWISTSYTGICSEGGESDGCYSFTPDPLISPVSPPSPYDNNGCEVKEYRCDSGYCVYGVGETRRADSCDTFGPNPLIWKDFQCVLDECKNIQEWPDGRCDTSISYTSLVAEDNIGVSILTQTEVSDSKTPVTLDVSMQDDESGIASCNLKWRKNGGTIQNINCLQGGVPCPTGESCNYSEVIGPFVDRDFVEYSVTITDGNDNIVNAPLSGWYSFTTRDECYYISDNYSSKFNVDNLTSCGPLPIEEDSPKCCGGHCDLTRTESSVYDDECTVDACSGESWIESNTNEFGDTENDAVCGSVGSCFDYYSPNNDFYSGCMNGGNKCSSGQCVTLSTLKSYPTCNVNSLTSYDCDDYETGTCGERVGGTNIDCSVAGVYDDDTIACNCDCNGYDREEKVYSSLSFDGVDDYVDIGDVNSWELGSDERMTIEAWINVDSLKNADIFGRNNNSWSVSNWTWNFYMYSTGALAFGIGNGSSNNYRSNFYTISTDKWKHVAIVVGAQNENIDFYVDGQFQTGKSITRTLGQLRQTSNSFRVGGEYNYFDGSIDEVRIYNRALYPEEVQDHYNGIFADNTGLVGHWDFDEGTGETVEDISESGNDGTLSNVDGKLYNMNSSDWVSGKYGNGLDFDGSNDYVEISGNLGDPSSMSLEFWFYVSESDKTRTQYLLEGRSLSVPSNWWFLQSYDPSGTGNINFYGKVKIDTSKWYAGKWNHLVLTTNSANSKIYINGEIKGTGAGYDPKFVDSMRIGTRYTNSNYFRGKFDEVRIYDRALSETEVGEHHKGVFSDNSGLVGYWDFNEGSGTIAYDSSENGPQWVKYGNGDDEDEDGNVINVLNRNVPAPWQVCTDNKDNDCDGDLNDYDEDNDTGASNCDGEVDGVFATATAMNRACVIEETCVEGSDLFPVGNVITVDDIDIERAENDFTISSYGTTDDFLIKEIMIEWTTDNWANKTNKTCEDEDVENCKVCVEGGSCGEDNDDILSSSLSAGNIFSFRVCAWDNSINRNQKCTDYYNIVIENSNSAPEVTLLSIRDHNFCTDGLEYVLEWTFSDLDGDTQASYEIQIKEGNNDFISGLVVDVEKNLSSSYYQILSGDFEDGEEIEYGEDKVYYWQLRVTDSRGGGYERTSEWVEGPSFITPMYNYPQVDFSAISDSGIDCLYATSYEYIGTENKCDFGENITFSDESVYVECDSPNNKQCISLNAVNCDVGEGRCIPCLIDNDCFKFNSGGISYSCVNEVCEASGSCADDDDCQAADAARCDIDVDTGIGLCAGCDDDSQCSNEKFETTDVDYFCNSDGVCDDKDRREWYFYGSDIGDPDSINPNPINNYIESESKTYNVIFKVKDIVGNSCYKIKKILLGGRDYPKWNESAVSN